MNDWGNKTISPRSTTPLKAHIRYPCPGLCRFFALVTFLVVGLGVFYGGLALLGLERLDWAARGWTTKHLALLVASTLLAMFSSRLAFAYTISIDVASERLSDLIIVLWQFLASGALLWFMLIGVAMSVSLGREEAKAAVLHFGAERATLHVVATACAVSLLSGVAFFIASRLRLSLIAYLASATTVSLVAAWWHFRLYGIEGQSWIVVGVITPILLLLSAPSMIERDRRQRRLVIEQFHK